MKPRSINTPSILQFVTSLDVVVVVVDTVVIVVVIVAVFVIVYRHRSQFHLLMFLSGN